MTAKNTQVGVGWVDAMESKERYLKGECFGGEEVNEIGRSMKGFNPVGRGMDAWKRRERSTSFVV